MAAFLIRVFLLLFCLCSSQSKEDLYTILGIKKTATNQEIKKAYRQRAKDTHPDKNTAEDTTVKFRLVSEAYETLSDPRARRVYDQFGQSANEQQNRRGFGGGGFGGGFNNNDFNNFFHHQRKKQHSHLYNPYLRRQILDAQSRVLNVMSLRYYHHLTNYLLI